MFLLGLLRAFTSRAHTPIIPIGVGFFGGGSNASFDCKPLSLLGLWLLAAVLPLNLRFARLLDLGIATLAVSPLATAFLLDRSAAEVSLAVSWCAPVVP
jgi:hypothetical protein